MLLSISKRSNFFTWVIITIFLFLNLFVSHVNSDPRATAAGGLICGTVQPPAPKYIIPTFVQGMELLSQNLNNTNNNFAISNFTNSSPLPFYALTQCHRDLSHTDCLVCYAVARTTLPRCLPILAGRYFLDGCFLRYDNYSFFQEAVDPVRDTVNCNSTVPGGSDWSNFQGGFPEFERSVGVLVENLTEIAVRSGGFGVLEVKGVFGLAQCWESLSSDGCRTCLEKAKKEVTKCLPSREGRGLNAGCYLRYSTQKFYNNDSQSNGGSSGISSPGAIVAIVLAVVAFVMISAFASYAAYLRISKLREERKNIGQISSSFNRSKLNFKYETLEKATNYFDLSNKVGQGGAGSVYKGTLPNGEVVAVKRLFFNTRQWVDEFFNEVNIISAIEHKNLVKLLGCSIEGPESLLVYEFVPNKSLDHFLFDKARVQILSWTQRIGVIVGTAEGLAYLHEGCHVRIIHRDIKSSNILLDKDLSPKIADFGLVRTFATDMSHLSTGIAGTLGYMAPEYIVRGQLTEKADVFSFGVLVLETVCGRRNNAFIEDAGSLLQSVWRLYKEGLVLEAVDPLLKGDFPEREALDVLQIGLLCTQASAALRPSMSEVVQMLTTNIEDRQIPIPHQPPFLNARALERGRHDRSQVVSSSTSSPLTKMEISYTTTSQSSTTPSSEWPLRIDESRSS